LVTINRIVKWIYLTFRVVPAMTETRSEGLSAIFAALSDPTRRVILERLSRGAATPGELARPLRISWPAVTKHLRVLERAGLLQRRRSGRSHILIWTGPIRQADEWIASYRRFWEGSLDAPADYLGRGVSKSERPAASRSKDRPRKR
jgi:DNA-binding transcriptional ArsR family regulator